MRRPEDETPNPAPLRSASATRYVMPLREGGSIHTGICRDPQHELNHLFAALVT